ncbi:MAG: peptidylprolyl isomerase [Bacteroidales bacterium]|nr:peptidylprolyl isomerase [Bacteroidales bacterium]
MKKLSALVSIVAIAVSCTCGGPKNTAPENVPEEIEEDTLTIVKPAVAGVQAALPEEPVFDIVTNLGTIKVRLYKDTPRHRDNFIKLATTGYYDSLLFHRVIKDFMIQGGDPLTRVPENRELFGQGGPDYTIPAEFVPAHRHKKGALAAARRGDAANPMKESSGSQFYLVQSPDNCVHLDGEYTVFGETVAGFNVIDKIASVHTDRYGVPLEDVRILSVHPDAELNKEQSE